MREKVHRRGGFTLVELLVVIAIIGILAAMLFPLLSTAVARGRQSICIANLKQITQGVTMYATDNRDILFPSFKKPGDVEAAFYFQEWTSYVPLTERYVAWKSDALPRNKIFACPADRFYEGLESGPMRWVNESLHSLSNVNYSSYFFNAANAVVQSPVRDKTPALFPGVLGTRLSAINAPVRTLLLGEAPAWDAYSWHSPSRPPQAFRNNAQDLLGFADGHVGYVKIYFDRSHYPAGVPVSVFAFDPPAGYDYQWSGN